MLGKKGQIRGNKNVKFLIAKICPETQRGQISETMSWIVATLVIIVVLVISIAAAGGSDAVKKAVGLERKFEIKTTSDLLVTKSLTGFLRTPEDGKKVYDVIQSEENLNDVNGKLAQDIFNNENIFPDKIIGPDRYVGVRAEGYSYYSQYKPNPYFDFENEWLDFIGSESAGDFGIYNEIVFNEGKWVVVYLKK